MLRVGLTGGLGSGKSTVAAMFRELGAETIESDNLGRALMEPGREAFGRIVAHFGPGVLTPQGTLDRARLAELSFRDGRVKELNAIIHPAVIAAQRKWMDELFARDPGAVAVIVSALLFEVERDAREDAGPIAAYADLGRRIDRIVLVTAADEDKIARYTARIAATGVDPERARADARSRLLHQIPDREKVGRADYLIENTGDMAHLRLEVERVWPRLREESNLNRTRESVK